MSAIEKPGRMRLSEYIHSIPEKTPQELYSLIRTHGYFGQDEAVRSLCLMAFRHIRRLKKIHVDGMDPDTIPKKQNSLLIGSTGCGKTYLIELLFKGIMNIPTAIVDITNYSETGYVGQDVTSILTRLYYAANCNADLASIGIICIDEIDKISSGQNSAVFSGAGTTKDVTGLGVQRELLKMLESTEVSVSPELSHSSYGSHFLLSTRDIAFIGAGAFSGFKAFAHSDGQNGIGFNRIPRPDDVHKIAVSYGDAEVENTTHFQKYGLLPELIGRFNRIIPFQALNEEDLCRILDISVIEKYRNDFLLDDIELIVTEEVKVRIAKKAVDKETGARGLDSVLTRYIEQAAFEAYSHSNTTQLILEVVYDTIRARII